MAHATTTCDACGAADDHPKLHYGPETYHHDCIPHKVVRDFTTDGYWSPVFGTDDQGQRVVIRMDWVDGNQLTELHPAHVIALALRDAALSGVRGDSLREHITALHALEV